jgi:hypothetical protein
MAIDSEDILVFVDDMENTLETNEFLQNNLQDVMKIFSQYVRRLHDGGYTYVEAIIDFCDNHDLAYEDCTKYICPDLLAEVRDEAIQLKQIKKIESVMQAEFTL